MPGASWRGCCARDTVFRSTTSTRTTGSTSRMRATAKAVPWRRWQGSGESNSDRVMRRVSNRPRHPAKKAPDRPGQGPPRSLWRLARGNAALTQIIQEQHVIRLGDGEMLVAEKHRVV